VELKQQCAAVAGASFIAITQLSTASTLNGIHRAALILFFVVLPLSVFGFVSNDRFVVGPHPKPYWLIQLIVGVSNGLFVAALSVLAFSFSVWTGIAFFLSVLVVFPLIIFVHLVR
jgi:hypothetical protein